MIEKFKHLSFSVLSKFITFSSLYFYAKIIKKEFVAEIALIQAYVVVIVVILSLQIPAAIFRLSIIKKYKNLSIWILEKSNILIFISLPIYFLNIFKSNFILIIIFLSLAQISVMNRLEFIRSNSNQINYFKLIFLQVLFSFAFIIIFFLYFKNIFTPINIFITFEYMSWILIFFFSIIKTKKISKVSNLIPKFNKKDLIYILQYGFYLIPTTLAWSGILYGPIIMINHYYNQTLVADFAISNRIALIIFILGTLILSVIGKDLILNYQKNKNLYYKNFFKKLFLWFLCTILLGVIIYYVNLFFLNFYFPEYKLTNKIILLQFINTILLSNFSFLGFFYQTTIRMKPNAITALLTFSSCLLFSIYFIKNGFGVTGMMSGMVIGILIGIILRIINIKNIIFDKSN